MSFRVSTCKRVGLLRTVDTPRAYAFQLSPARIDLQRSATQSRNVPQLPLRKSYSCWLKYYFNPPKGVPGYTLHVKPSIPPNVAPPLELEFAEEEIPHVIALNEFHTHPSHAFVTIADRLATSIQRRYPQFLGVRLGLVPSRINPRFAHNPFREKQSELTSPEVANKRSTTDLAWEFQSEEKGGQRIAGVEHRPKIWKHQLMREIHAPRRRLSLVLWYHYFGSNSSDMSDLHKDLDVQGLRSAHRHQLLDRQNEILKVFEEFPDDNPQQAFIHCAKFAFQSADKHANADSRLEKVQLAVIPTGEEGHRNHSCEMALRRAQYEMMRHAELQVRAPAAQHHRAYIALGSNVGNCIDNIESACRMMTASGIKVTRTSALYETAPMYLEAQATFVNGVCEVETSMEPLDLLRQLQQIEKDIGRIKTVENGPRTIDLDILLYDERTVQTETLLIPHPRIMEREFVLRPLSDLIPDVALPASNPLATFKAQLDELSKPPSPLSPLTPLAPSIPPLASQHPNRRTHLMAILNLTPDSFSDGGLNPTDPEKLLPTIRTFLSHHNPPTILDVGGQSTRPHSPQITAEEELARVLPTITAIRNHPSFSELVISVDTYRASVASATIAAGANIINDVSGGTLDPGMLPTIAKLGCTCILMHMRGTPETMNTLTSYPDGVIAGVGNELAARVQAAEEAGIRRWRIILDPGIGFAKTGAQNLELLRRLDELREFGPLRGLPWVVGASRKKFIGKITGVKEAKERGWGTAACVAAAVKGGADVVRVHDVKEMGEVVEMARAIWRV